MALFGDKQKKGPAREKKVAKVSSRTPAKTADTSVLLSPRVTEKAAILSDSSVYVFAVTKSATKPQIARAIEVLFKVVPRKVNIVHKKGTAVTTRATGKKGVSRSMKKAYVYLNKGEKIELA